VKTCLWIMLEDEGKIDEGSLKLELAGSSEACKPRNGGETVRLVESQVRPQVQPHCPLRRSS
jgi:hypothetical protein